MDHFEKTDRHWGQKEVKKYLSNRQDEIAWNGSSRVIEDSQSENTAITPPIDSDGQWNLLQWDKDGDRVRMPPGAAGAYEKASWNYYDQYGHMPQVNDTYRTYEEQAQLYSLKAGKQAVARPGHSRHESGRSIDVQDYEGMKPFLEEQGFVWPNYNNDSWHFDYSPSQVKKKKKR